MGDHTVAGLIAGQESLEREIATLREQLAAKTAEVERLDEQNEAYAIQFTGLVQDVDRLTKDLDEARASLARVEAERDEAKAEARSARNDYWKGVERFHAAEAECSRLRGLTPEFPPMPPKGAGLPRYGLRWNGPDRPLAVPMADGYWTPWHLAESECSRLREEGARAFNEGVEAAATLADLEARATKADCGDSLTSRMVQGCALVIAKAIRALKRPSPATSTAPADTSLRACGRCGYSVVACCCTERSPTEPADPSPESVDRCREMHLGRPCVRERNHGGEHRFLFEPSPESGTARCEFPGCWEPTLVPHTHPGGFPDIIEREEAPLFAPGVVLMEGCDCGCHTAHGDDAQADACTCCERGGERAPVPGATTGGDAPLGGIVLGIAAEPAPLPCGCRGLCDGSCGSGRSPSPTGGAK